MKIKLIAYGIAKDILQTNSMDLEVSESASILDVKLFLATQFPEFEKLQSLKLAVNEDYQSDDFTLQPNDEVVIIPPVSGG
ncbi:MAG: MoaD/ThiS family protein [Cyclobacteriaceae bacterium]